MRHPSGCHHLSDTEQPHLLFGVHPDAVIERGLELATQAIGIRITTPILLAGVMTWPVLRKEIEQNEEEKKKYLAWRADAITYAQQEWGGDLKCIVEHVDEDRLHLHYWALPPLRPDRQLRIADVDFGRRAANEVKNAGGTGRQQRDASARAMKEFQDRYHAEVGVKHGLERLGPVRLRLTRQEWKERKAEAQRIADAWQRLHRDHEELQAAANAHVAARTTEARRAADEAAAAAARRAEQQVAEIKAQATQVVRKWKQHAIGLSASIERQKDLIAAQEDRIRELEALLREQVVNSGPGM